MLDILIIAYLFFVLIISVIAASRAILKRLTVRRQINARIARMQEPRSEPLVMWWQY